MAFCKLTKPCGRCKRCSDPNWRAVSERILSEGLTGTPSYYILEVDTLVDDQAYDDPHQPGLKAYSVIKIDESGAYEVDRAYRNVREALEAWPEAMPPRS